MQQFFVSTLLLLCLLVSGNASADTYKDAREARRNSATFCQYIERWLIDVLGSDFDERIQKSDFGVFDDELAYGLRDQTFVPHFGYRYSELPAREKRILEAVMGCGWSLQTAYAIDGIFAVPTPSRWADKITLALNPSTPPPQATVDQVFASNIPAPPPLPAGYSRMPHDRGALLKSHPDFDIYSSHSSTSGPSQCGPTQRQRFEVSTVFKVDKDFVFTREYLGSDFRDALHQVRNEYCPAVMINSKNYISNVYLGGAWAETSERDASRGQQFDKPLTSSLLRYPDHSVKPSNPPGPLNVYYAGESFANQDKFYPDYVNEVGSVTALQAYMNRGRKTVAQLAALQTQQDSATATRLAREEAFARNVARTGWPGGDSKLFEIYRGEYPNYSTLDVPEKADFQLIFLSYVDKSFAVCGENTPNETVAVGYDLEVITRDAFGTFRSLTEADYEILVDTQLLSTYLAFAEDSDANPASGLGAAAVEVAAQRDDTRPSPLGPMSIERNLSAVFSTWKCAGSEIERLQANLLSVAQN